MEFGILSDGKKASLYSITDGNGCELRVTDYGATIVSYFVPDKDGKIRDIVLGYDSAPEYEKNSCYFGAVIGRGCNRIRDGRFSLKNIEYQLDKNDRGNNLHSGKKGFDRRIWEVVDKNKREILFRINEKDMENGYPGNMTAEVRYCFEDVGKLKITYNAVSDKDTVANMTNHSYFNLNGHDGGSVENHMMTLNAKFFTPNEDECAIATGEILAVKNTPFDFTEGKCIGDGINEENRQLKFVGGFDQNYVIEGQSGVLRKAAEACSSDSGICLELYTDTPGIEFYAGNMIPEHTGKKNVVYGKRCGFCLEPEYFPDSINISHFKQPFIKAGEKYESVTVIRCGAM